MERNQTATQTTFLNALTIEQLDTLIGWLLNPQTVPHAHNHILDAGLTFDMARSEQDARIAADHAVEIAEIEDDFADDTDAIVTLIVTPAQANLFWHICNCGRVNVNGIDCDFTMLTTRIKGTIEMFSVASELIHQEGDEISESVLHDQQYSYTANELKFSQNQVAKCLAGLIERVDAIN